jgi:hypothetical protein
MYDQLAARQRALFTIVEEFFLRATGDSVVKFAARGISPQWCVNVRNLLLLAEFKLFSGLKIMFGRSTQRLGKRSFKR